jgi:hypothetical protein
MSEQIRELWRQAVLNNTKTPINFQDAADEFAELLLFECIKIAVFRGDLATAKALKEHFEVEP